MNTQPPRQLVLGALIVVQVLFAVNYVVSKIVVSSFPPLVWASTRVIVSSLAMLAVTVLARRRHPKADWGFFGPLIIFSLLGTIINQSCFLVGLSYTTSTNSAILNTLIPVFTLMIVTLRGQEPATVRKVAGFLFAFAGVLALRKVENLNLSDKTLVGDLLTIVNCLSYALFLSFSKKFVEKHDPLWTSTWMFLYGGVGITLIALPQWSHFHLPLLNTRLWWAIGFAIFGATLLTYFLNFWALAYAKSSQVAVFIYIQPVIAAGIAWFFQGEAITLRTVLSSSLIFFGLILGISRRTSASPGDQACTTSTPVSGSVSSPTSSTASS